MQIGTSVKAAESGSGHDAILVVNAGSSSIKFALYASQGSTLRRLSRGQAEALGTSPRFVARNANGEVVSAKDWPAGARPGHAGAMQHIFEVLPDLLQGHRVRAVGHRVVHGGTEFGVPVLVDAEVLQRMQALSPLAPLHQPHNLAAITALMSSAPEVPQIACFDTAFHRTQPAVAQDFALPYKLSDEGLRRYGFHGLSYEHIAGALAHTVGTPSGRVVAMHLGNGASMCALRDGVSVATTMGMTALDGLMMGTRCGSIDPGAVLYLILERGMSAQQVQALLYEESGLLGVSGISKDMRQLHASDDRRARQAIDLFVYRIGRELGSMAAALGGLDALVFSAGIGENSAAVRERVCRDAGWLGVELDSFANQRNDPCISAPGSAVAVWVIPADEELMIARHTLAVLDRQ